MDWEDWAHRAEQALNVEERGDWKVLFAPDAIFGDPHTPSTKDLRAVARHTRKNSPIGARRSSGSAAVTDGPCSRGSAAVPSRRKVCWAAARRLRLTVPRSSRSTLPGW